MQPTRPLPREAGLPCFAAGAFSNTWDDDASDPILNAAGASRVDLIFNQQQIVLSGVEAKALAVAPVATCNSCCPRPLMATVGTNGAGTLPPPVCSWAGGMNQPRALAASGFLLAEEQQ